MGLPWWLQWTEDVEGHEVDLEDYAEPRSPYFGESLYDLEKYKKDKVEAYEVDLDDDTIIGAVANNASVFAGAAAVGIGLVSLLKMIRK